MVKMKNINEYLTENLNESLNESLLVGVTWLTLLGIFAIAMNNAAIKDLSSTDITKKGLFANIKDHGVLSGVTLWIYKHCQNLSKLFDTYDISSSLDILQNDKAFQDFLKTPGDQRSLKDLDKICRDAVGMEIDKENIMKVWKAIQKDCSAAKQVNVK